MAEPLKTNQQIDQLIKECMTYKSLIDTLTPVEKEQIDWRLLYWAKIVNHKHAPQKIEDLKAKISQLKADSDYVRASAMERLIEEYERDILTGRSVQQIYYDQDIFDYIQNYSKILEFDTGRHYTLKETLKAIDDLFSFQSEVKSKDQETKPSIESIDDEPDKLNLKTDHEEILRHVYMHKGDKQQRDLFLRNWIALGDLDEEDSIGKVSHLIGQIKDQNPDINKSDPSCRGWLKLYWSHKTPKQE